MNPAALALALASAREQLDAQAAALARAQADRARAKETLQQLLHYRSALHARIQPGTCADGAQLAERQRFTRQLDEAIRLQREQLHAADHAHEGQRARWLPAQRRVLALETVAQRLAHEQALLASRRQQRDTDAHAARIASTRWSEAARSFISEDPRP